MTHNPCGEINKSAPCTGASACKKRFSKPPRADTGHSNSDYYIVYRCRSPQDSGVSTEKQVRAGRLDQVVTLHNSGVVPHSPTLLRMFLWHTNFQRRVSYICDINYLIKYVCKSSDRVKFEIIPHEQR